MSEPVVRIIKANPFINKVNLEEGNLLKVAAYARVSTDHEEQEDSFERQVEYYTHYINTNPSWKLVKVYSDPGISGTRADKRPGFQEMIRDCKKGLINRILCKSIARFARNTVDCLRYIRELKELGVSIFFEAQNIDTLTPGGDILLTLLAASAEEESRTISKNIRWAYQKKFEKGDFTFDYKHFLGLTRDEDGKVVIIEEQAQVVRRIYREYLKGYSISQIANGLEKDGIKSPWGRDKWYYATIQSILTNEKYYGACLMGKTFKPDITSKKRYKNEGQVQSYFAENIIPPIVDKKTWDLVQIEMKERTKKLEEAGQFDRYVSRLPFSKMIKCSKCGANYVRCNNKRKEGQRVNAWVCKNRRKTNHTCEAEYISEDSIIQAYLKMIKGIKGSSGEVCSILKASTSKVVVNDPTEKIKSLNAQIDSWQDEMMQLLTKKNNGDITDMDYAQRGQKIASFIDNTKSEIDSLSREYATTSSAIKRIEDITNVLENVELTEKFDTDVFKTLVEEILVKDDVLEFKLKCGISREVKI